MAGLVPAIHVLLAGRKAWMPATSAGMTEERVCKSLRLDLGVGDDLAPLRLIGLDAARQLLWRAGERFDRPWSSYPRP
jgi:hypothetical protein